MLASCWLILIFHAFLNIRTAKRSLIVQEFALLATSVSNGPNKSFLPPRNFFYLISILYSLFRYLRAISCPVGESNPFRLMAHLARTEGVGSLWSGLPATMVMAFPATILYFTSYEQFRDIFENLLPENSQKVAPFIGGAAARTLTTLVGKTLDVFFLIGK